MNLPLDNRYYPLILDVLDQGVFAVDESTNIISFNRAAEQITQYSAEEVMGHKCSEIFRTSLCNQLCPLRQSIQSRNPVRNKEVYIKARDGRPIPITIATAPLVTKRGKLIGGVEVFRDISNIVELKRRLDNKYRLVDIIGKSPAMRKLFELLPLIANSESTVLISGASGTGKELVARTIHSLGPRAQSPFIPINCAAIPETLLEAELFGHKKGAFTDAKKDRLGRIAAADAGTLFLDEIGDLPKSMQAKVLRFLQDRTYEQLGSNRSIRANVRVIAATNRDLLQLVQQGDFREDLYFRLNVVQLEIPPLVERTEDIALLVNHFVNFFRESTGKPIEGLNETAMSYLMNYSFPGNVRELENIIERAFILCQSNRIDVEHLPPAILSLMPPRSLPSALHHSYGQLDHSKATEIRAALVRHNGNRTQAAAELGIHRITLLRRMQRLGLV